MTKQKVRPYYHGVPRRLTRSSKKVSPCWSCCLRRWPHRRWIPLLPKLFQWRPNNVGLELFWIVIKLSPPPPWGTSLEGLPLCKSLGSFAEQVDWPFWMIWWFLKGQRCEEFLLRQWLGRWVSGKNCNLCFRNRLLLECNHFTSKSFMYLYLMFE